MENNSTQEEVKSEPSDRQQSGADDGWWWSRFKALGHGLLEAVGLRKKNKNPLGELHSESCHLGGEPDHFATQYRHYLLEKLGLTSKDAEEEPSPSGAQERLEFIE